MLTHAALHFERLLSCAGDEPHTAQAHVGAPVHEITSRFYCDTRADERQTRLILSLSLLVNTDLITAGGSEKYLATACNGIDKVDTFVSHKMAPRAV